MQVNYFLSANSHPLFYQFHVANRHLQTARAIYKDWSSRDHSEIEGLAKRHILTPNSTSEKTSLKSWAFHLILGLAQLGLADFFIFPGIGLAISLADRYFFDQSQPCIPPVYTPPIYTPPTTKRTEPKISLSSPSDLAKAAIEALKTQGISTKPYCYQEGDDKKVCAALHDLKNKGFFESKAQDIAKTIFKEVMAELGLSVSYVNAEGWDYTAPLTKLDHSIFHWSKTFGVENDIPRASQDRHRIHLFSAASQYNAAEAPSAYTPPIGEAMQKSKNDQTQGPLAQRTNPAVFELVTAFLTHLGFNMMEKALPSAGTTYTDGSAIEHGYLRPTNQNVEALANELEAHFPTYEAPCYESRLTASAEPVYLMLGAAPAIGYSYGLNANSLACKKLQYYAYIANLTTQFKQALFLLKENTDKEVVLHITGTGLGVFGCDNDEFAKAFRQTASIFQSLLDEKDKKRMHVQLESYHGFNGPDELKAVSETLLKLGIDKPRVE